MQCIPIGKRIMTPSLIECDTFPCIIKNQRHKIIIIF